MAKVTPREQRIKRHRRIRKKVAGTAERPRLCVFRSNLHIYAQIIDDVAGHTLVSASTMDKQSRSALNDNNKTEQAQAVGKLIAQRALDAGISQVVFDRGGFLYHGRVKALAEAAREAGLTF
ncbi:MAG: 50S ribosomal protein L18 [Chloroflexaceae bacterium]|nr:50S ribosomal protein L18 [Chloroflexaceae bacterium]NJL33525.1 50S ribosomal protein L18 [Chloroflexaceae bacterium]NJO04750.1 50S ribosomal protein L18 [Chloroflexaceae bacterium]